MILILSWLFNLACLQLEHKMVVRLFVFYLGSQASDHFALAIAPIRDGAQVTNLFRH